MGISIPEWTKPKISKIGYTKNISSSHDTVSSGIILGLELKFLMV